MLQSVYRPWVSSTPLPVLQPVSVARIKSSAVPAFVTRNAAQRPTDSEFVALLSIYRATGGLATGDEVAERMRRVGTGEVGTLARLISQREVVCFVWNTTFWLPWFQFNPANFLVKPAVRSLLRELGTTLDEWELVQWIATPNAGLRDQAPIELIDQSPGEVVNAARLTRFIAVG